jgi:flagellar biosynthesis GTPase FlhF
MHSRQSGAAHVPIMFFLLLLIMFLGTLVFGWLKLNEANDLRTQRDSANAKAAAASKRELLIQHYVEDIGRVVGKPGKYEGRGGGAAVYGEASIADLVGLMSPADLKKVLDDACRGAEVGEAQGLENVLGAMITRMGQLKAQASNAEVARDQALAEKSEIDRKFQDAVSQQQARAREWAQNLENARAEYENSRQDKDRTNANLTQNLQEKADQLISAKEQAAKTEEQLRKEIAKKEMHASSLVMKDQMRNPPDVADGKVIAARAGLPSAFINLGKKDNLPNGTVFWVRNPHNEKVKALATVTRVEDERAEVSLSQVADPVGDAVREGDLLYNPIYSPNLTRTIFLMGRFSAPYDKDRVEALLKRLGNKVVTKIGPGVDTVVLGDNPVNEAGDGFAEIKESSEYKDALQLGVEMMPLLKIRDLLKLDR